MLKVAINGYGRIGRIVHRQLVKQFARPSRSSRHQRVQRRGDAPLSFEVRHAARTLRCRRDRRRGASLGERQTGARREGAGSRQVSLGRRWASMSSWRRPANSAAATRARCTPRKPGAKAVLVTAPPKDDIPMIVRGVNDADLQKAMPIVSAARAPPTASDPSSRCWTNRSAFEGSRVAPRTHIRPRRTFSITIHRQLGKVRLARAAAMSIIPSTTGAVKAVAKSSRTSRARWMAWPCVSPCPMFPPRISQWK